MQVHRFQSDSSPLSSILARISLCLGPCKKIHATWVGLCVFVFWYTGVVASLTLTRSNPTQQNYLLSSPVHHVTRATRSVPHANDTPSHMPCKCHAHGSAPWVVFACSTCLFVPPWPSLCITASLSSVSVFRQPPALSTAMGSSSQERTASHTFSFRELFLFACSKQQQCSCRRGMFQPSQ